MSGLKGGQGHQDEAMRQKLDKQTSILVKIIEAKGIQAADRGGTSDPFIELRIRGSTATAKTQIIKKTVTPYWNEEFVLYPNQTAPENDVLELKLYDFDAGTTNDFLGSVDVPLAEIAGKVGPPKEYWKELGKKKGAGIVKTGKYGELHFTIEWRDPNAAPPPAAVPATAPPMIIPPPQAMPVNMGPPFAQAPYPVPQPMPPMQAQIHMPQTSSSYVCKQYQPPAPAPLAAVIKPLPAVRAAEKELERQRELKAKEAKYEQAKQKQASKKGLFGKLGKAAVSVVAVADSAAHKGGYAMESKYQGKSDAKSMSRFRAIAFPPEEKLVGDYHCSVSCGRHVGTGYFFVSTWFATFDGKINKLQTGTEEHTPLRIVLPLNQIVSIRTGVAQGQAEKGVPKNIVLNPGPEVPGNPGSTNAGPKAPFYNAILIYTADGNQHELYDFTHYQINWFEDMFNVLDHTWRSANGFAGPAGQPNAGQQQNFGQPPMGQPPTGQPPMGQPPMGQPWQ